MSTLPNPRQLLTDLISSLPPQSPPYRSTTDSGNALQNLAPTDHHLLSTLHVLFPSLLLPSLDLLDRGLVTRITQNVQSSETARDGPGGPEILPPANSTETAAHLKGSRVDGHIHLVQSAQESRGRRFGQAGPVTSYIVHLAAWNCSCAAFTFSAFPGSANYGKYHFEEAEVDLLRGMPDRAEELNRAGEFGGLSLDGVNGEAVPCCKHLLACLLAERWESVLGDYIKKRNVDREEMAGLGGET